MLKKQTGESVRRLTIEMASMIMGKAQASIAKESEGLICQLDTG